MFILCQADGDLVSAVDFSPHYLVTGHEDSYVGVWKLPEGTRTHTLTGHNGGVTGISLQGSLAATSSYDSMVRLWNVEAGTCLLTFSDPENFVRCVALHGQRIVSGDFGGEVHLWDLKFKDKEGNFEVTNHRKWECHKGHIVCIQLSASRIVTGSRDRHVIINDFWAKTQVFGRVQGVFFRKFTQQQASALGLRGWVKNTMTKSVVGQIEGDGAKVEQMKVWLKETGSPKSRIDKVAFSNQREIDRYSFQTFEIRR